MAYKSNAADVMARLIRGLDHGLTAAAENYTTKVRTRLDRGYTTGAFSHHARGVAGRVMYTTPFGTPDGGRAITMGTSKTDGYPYELAWELGHVNVFIGAGHVGGGTAASSVSSHREGSYIRVEVWRPQLEQDRDLLTRIIARNVAREVGGAGATIAAGGTG